MSWFLAAVGFMALIVLHEAGHFAAAKAVGMRVERFSLFFPPLLLRKKVGETEYAIGALPLGGYVKISGMNPSEQLSDEVRTRAYYSQPVWKRVVVIAAGPFVNLVLGLLLLVVAYGVIGPHSGTGVTAIQKGFPAQGVLHAGDELQKVDGHGGTPQQLSDRIQSHKCAKQPPTPRCLAATTTTLTIKRHGRLMTFTFRPIYDASTKSMRVGFGFDPGAGPHQSQSFGTAVSDGTNQFWNIVKGTVTLPAKLLNANERKQLHGTVGLYETTRQTILHDPGDVVYILAVISLALAIVNLFPFLPLDGGHIFWALVELVRRRPVAFSTMERSGVVGFALVLMIFVIGFTNDINTLSHGGFHPPK